MKEYLSIFVGNTVVRNGGVVPMGDRVQDLDGRWRTPSTYEVAVISQDAAEILAAAAPKPARRRSLWDRLLGR